MLLPIKSFSKINIYFTESMYVNFFSFLIILLPFALITGPALPDIFISLIGIYFLVQSVKKKLWFYYKNPIVIGILIFCLYGILRSTFAELHLNSLTNEGSVFYFRYLFFALGFAYLLKMNSQLSKYFLFSLIICVIFVSLDAYYQYFRGVNILGNSIIAGQNRLTGFFGDEAIVGRYIAYLTPLIFCSSYNIFQINKKFIFLSISLFIFTEVIVFLSGERAPFFYISTFSILIAIFIPKFRLIRIFGIFISIISILLVLEIKPEARVRMIDTTINQVSSNIIPYMPYSRHHEEHYIGALKIFKDKPLFGIGTNLFRYVCDRPKYVYERSCSSHPHNYYIQILSEKGLIGFLFLLIFYIYFCYLAIRQFYYMVRGETQNLIPFHIFLFIILILVFWWPIIPTMSFYNNWNNVFIYLPLAYYFFFTNKDIKDSL